ncbi:MAG: carbohydrate binding domain-containing protein, partial [Armatimonadetes bacterium]|nr:carbohydrate binding domain-containing protein [Armatimonadota bacterium]
MLIVLAGSGLIAAEPLSLDNAGFEQGSAQWLLKPGSVTAEIAPDCNFSHSGQASLRLSGAAAENPYAAQLVGRIEPLATYRLAAMVRAAEGSRAVAAVRIEFYDGGNRNISVWRQQLRTNPDGTWQAIEQTATAEAAGVNAVVVLRLAGPGELWFDDVELTVVSPGPELWAIPSELAITADRPDTIAFDLHLDQQTKSAPPLQFSINCPAMVERIVPDFRLDRANDQILSVLLTLPALLPGLYTLGIVRTDTGAVGQANVVVIPADCRSQAIRSDGVIPVGGEPFFPICARWGDATEFEALQTAGFNTVECLPMDDLERLGQLLDAAQEHHLKAIVPLYDSTDSPKALADCAKKVERFADHPALLAWKLMHLPT